MPQNRTWWGNEFIEALSNFMDKSRLARGRSYSKPHRILNFSVRNNFIESKLRGNINPYFGVYKEPQYRIKIIIKTISQNKWSQIINIIGYNAGMLSKLMMGQIPRQIKDVFMQANSHLLPKTLQDLQTSCSCPDWANPCKHIAGTYFKLASLLDNDPFLLFELRGIPRQSLRASLEKTPLGKALSASLKTPEDIKFVPDESLFTKTKTIPFPKETSLKEYYGTNTPDLGELGAGGVNIPAIIIKKQNDYPPFWPNKASFISTMEDIYTHIRKKNKITKPVLRFSR